MPETRNLYLPKLRCRSLSNSPGGMTRGRGRGRGRGLHRRSLDDRFRSQSASSSPTVANKVGDSPKRGPGRPKTNQEEKRGPGRPRKNPVKDEPQNKDPVKDEPSDKHPVKDEPTDIVKRGRGRPPKKRDGEETPKVGRKATSRSPSTNGKAARDNSTNSGASDNEATDHNLSMESKSGEEITSTDSRRKGKHRRKGSSVPNSQTEHTSEGINVNNKDISSKSGETIKSPTSSSSACDTSVVSSNKLTIHPNSPTKDVRIIVRKVTDIKSEATGAKEFSLRKHAMTDWTDSGAQVGMAALDLGDRIAKSSAPAQRNLFEYFETSFSECETSEDNASQCEGSETKSMTSVQNKQVVRKKKRRKSAWQKGVVKKPQFKKAPKKLNLSKNIIQKFKERHGHTFMVKSRKGLPSTSGAKSSKPKRKLSWKPGTRRKTSLELLQDLRESQWDHEQISAVEKDVTDVTPERPTKYAIRARSKRDTSLEAGSSIASDNDSFMVTTDDEVASQNESPARVRRQPSGISATVVKEDVIEVAEEKPKEEAKAAEVKRGRGRPKKPVHMLKTAHDRQIVLKKRVETSPPKRRGRPVRRPAGRPAGNGNITAKKILQTVHKNRRTRTRVAASTPVETKPAFTELQPIAKQEPQVVEEPGESTKEEKTKVNESKIDEKIEVSETTEEGKTKDAISNEDTAEEGTDKESIADVGKEGQPETPSIVKRGRGRPKKVRHPKAGDDVGSAKKQGRSKRTARVVSPKSPDDSVVQVAGTQLANLKESLPKKESAPWINSPPPPRRMIVLTPENLKRSEERELPPPPVLSQVPERLPSSRKSVPEPPKLEIELSASPEPPKSSVSPVDERAASVFGNQRNYSRGRSVPRQKDVNVISAVIDDADTRKESAAAPVLATPPAPSRPSAPSSPSLSSITYLRIPVQAPSVVNDSKITTKPTSKTQDEEKRSEVEPDAVRYDLTKESTAQNDNVIPDFRALLGDAITTASPLGKKQAKKRKVGRPPKVKRGSLGSPARKETPAQVPQQPDVTETKDVTEQTEVTDDIEVSKDMNNADEFTVPDEEKNSGDRKMEDPAVEIVERKLEDSNVTEATKMKDKKTAEKRIAGHRKTEDPPVGRKSEGTKTKDKKQTKHPADTDMPSNVSTVAVEDNTQKADKTATQAEVEQSTVSSQEILQHTSEAETIESETTKTKTSGIETTETEATESVTADTRATESNISVTAEKVEKVLPDETEEVLIQSDNLPEVDHAAISSQEVSSKPQSDTVSQSPGASGTPHQSDEMVTESTTHSQGEEDVTPQRESCVTQDDGCVTPQDENDITPQNENDVTPQNGNDVTPQNENDVTSQDENDVTPQHACSVIPQHASDVTPKEVHMEPTVDKEPSQETEPAQSSDKHEESVIEDSNEPSLKIGAEKDEICTEKSHENGEMDNEENNAQMSDGEGETCNKKTTQEKVIAESSEDSQTSIIEHPPENTHSEPTIDNQVRNTEDNQITSTEQSLGSEETVTGGTVEPDEIDTDTTKSTTTQTTISDSKDNNNDKISSSHSAHTEDSPLEDNRTQETSTEDDVETLLEPTGNTTEETPIDKEDSNVTPVENIPVTLERTQSPKHDQADTVMDGAIVGGVEDVNVGIIRSTIEDQEDQEIRAADTEPVLSKEVECDVSEEKTENENNVLEDGGNNLVEDSHIIEDTPIDDVNSTVPISEETDTLKQTEEDEVKSPPSDGSQQETCEAKETEEGNYIETPVKEVINTPTEDVNQEDTAIVENSQETAPEQEELPEEVPDSSHDTQESKVEETQEIPETEKDDLIEDIVDDGIKRRRSSEHEEPEEKKLKLSLEEDTIDPEHEVEDQPTLMSQDTTPLKPEPEPLHVETVTHNEWSPAPNISPAGSLERSTGKRKKYTGESQSLLKNTSTFMDSILKLESEGSGRTRRPVKQEQPKGRHTARRSRGRGLRRDSREMKYVSPYRDDLSQDVLSDDQQTFDMVNKGARGGFQKRSRGRPPRKHPLSQRVPPEVSHDQEETPASNEGTVVSHGESPSLEVSGHDQGSLSEVSTVSEIVKVPHENIDEKFAELAKDMNGRFGTESKKSSRGGFHKRMRGRPSKRHTSFPRVSPEVTHAQEEYIASKGRAIFSEEVSKVTPDRIETQPTTPAAAAAPGSHKRKVGRPRTKTYPPETVTKEVQHPTSAGVFLTGDGETGHLTVREQQTEETPLPTTCESKTQYIRYPGSLKAVFKTKPNTSPSQQKAPISYEPPEDDYVPADYAVTKMTAGKLKFIRKVRPDNESSSSSKEGSEDPDAVYKRKKKGGAVQKSYKKYKPGPLFTKNKGKIDVHDSLDTLATTEEQAYKEKNIPSPSKMKTRGKQNRHWYLFAKQAKMPDAIKKALHEGKESKHKSNINKLLKKCKPCKVVVVDFIRCLDLASDSEIAASSAGGSVTNSPQTFDVSGVTPSPKRGLPSDSSPDVTPQAKRSKPGPKSKKNNTQPNTSNFVPILPKPSSNYERQFVSFLSKSNSPQASTQQPSTLPPGIRPIETAEMAKPITSPPALHEEAPTSGSNTSISATENTTERPIRKLPKKGYKCVHCNYVTAIRTVMQEHIYNHTDVVPFMCGYCGAIFGTKSGVTIHNKREHPNLPPVWHKNDSINEEAHYYSLSGKAKPMKKESVKADVAAEQAASPSPDNEALDPDNRGNEMQLKELTEPGKRGPHFMKPRIPTLLTVDSTLPYYQCRHCTYANNSESTISLHVNIYHKFEKNYVCSHCDHMYFKDEESITAHFKRVHPNVPPNLTPQPNFIKHAPIPRKPGQSYAKVTTEKALGKSAKSMRLPTTPSKPDTFTVEENSPKTIMVSEASQGSDVTSPAQTATTDDVTAKSSKVASKSSGDGTAVCEETVHKTSVPKVDGKSAQYRIPTQPLRPFSAYMKAVFDTFRAENPGKKDWEIKQLIGQKWSNMADHEKKYYKDKYDAEIVEYHKAMKVFRPDTPTQAPSPVPEKKAKVQEEPTGKETAASSEVSSSIVANASASQAETKATDEAENSAQCGEVSSTVNEEQISKAGSSGETINMVVEEEEDDDDNDGVDDDDDNDEGLGLKIVCVESLAGKELSPVSAPKEIPATSVVTPSVQVPVSLPLQGGVIILPYGTALPNASINIPIMPSAVSSGQNQVVPVLAPTSQLQLNSNLISAAPQNTTPVTSPVTTVTQAASELEKAKSPPPPPKPKTPEEDGTVTVYQCVQSKCSFQDIDFEVMVRHIGNVHKLEYWFACPHCPFGCSGKMDVMRGHIARAHDTATPNDFGIIEQEKYFTTMKLAKQKGSNSVKLPDKPVPEVVTKPRRGRPPGKKNKTTVPPRAKTPDSRPESPAVNNTKPEIIIDNAEEDIEEASNQVADEPETEMEVEKEPETEEKSPEVPPTAEKPASERQEVSVIVSASSDPKPHAPVLSNLSISEEVDQVLRNIMNTANKQLGPVSPGEPVTSQANLSKLPGGGNRPPPPPLIPMSSGARRPSHTATLATQAPPLQRAPIASVRQTAVNLSTQRRRQSDEEVEDIEAYKVFNLVPKPRTPSISPNLRPATSAQARPTTSMTNPDVERWRQIQMAQMNHRPMMPPMVSNPPPVRKSMMEAHRGSIMSQFNLSRARSMHPMRSPPPAHTKVPVPNVNDFDCPYCIYKGDPDSLHNHILSHAPNIRWTCPYCAVPIQMLKNQVASHINSTHPGSRVVYIPYGVPWA